MISIWILTVWITLKAQRQGKSKCTLYSKYSKQKNILKNHRTFVQNVIYTTSQSAQKGRNRFEIVSKGLLSGWLDHSLSFLAFIIWATNSKISNNLSSVECRVFLQSCDVEEGRLNSWRDTCGAANPAGRASRLAGWRLISSQSKIECPLSHIIMCASILKPTYGLPFALVLLAELLLKHR